MHTDCLCNANPFPAFIHAHRYLHALVDPDGPGGRGVVSSRIMDELLLPVYERDPFLPAQALSFAVEECQFEV